MIQIHQPPIMQRPWVTEAQNQTPAFGNVRYAVDGSITMSALGVGVVLCVALALLRGGVTALAKLNDSKEESVGA